jgi:selenophosphate synthase
MFVKPGRKISGRIAVCNKFKDIIKMGGRELKDIDVN